jgi:PAS domain S-box-containing protein
VAASADRFEELIEAVPAVIYEAGRGIEGEWTYVSPQIRKLIGDSPEAWMADPDLYARRIHPADRKAVFETEDDEFAIASRENATVVAEYRMLHADGHLVWVRDEATLVNADSDSPFWRGLLIDITIERTARTELTETFQRHQADRLAATSPAGPGSVDVFRITCRDCDEIRASESPRPCPACGGASVVAESMDGMSRQLDVARSSVEDLLDGVHRHLELLGIGLRGDTGLQTGSRRVLMPLHQELDESA